MEFKPYNPAEIEPKWQKHWDDNQTFAATNDYSKPKFYGLIEFPYPSGNGLHVGHPRSNTAMDIISRKRRMEGHNVLFPIGWDAFGLPTENFAIKNNIHPAIVTKQNVDHFRMQLKRLGFSFDYSREVDTTDPGYYKWTQWIFLQLFKKGLAYKTSMPVNWCTSCKCVLANEEVVNGGCERCGSEVIRKEKSQWMLAITKYADRLIDDLDELDYIERVKVQQKNWIGRSYGTEATFKTNTGDDVTVYTTRVDTIFGVTYMVISPEHPQLDQWKDKIGNWDEVEAYRVAAGRKSDFERGELNKEKTGVRLEGIEIYNPINGKAIPMFVSDYVLMGYGTGAIMAVPAHDTRDWEFAKKFGIDIIQVIEGGDINGEAYTLDGVHINSEFLDGLDKQEAIDKMISVLPETYVEIDGNHDITRLYFEFDPEVLGVEITSDFDYSHPNTVSIVEPTEYQELMEYAFRRLDGCKYGEKKLACKHCPTHCYKPAMREKIREVMRWAGPRMMLYSPIAAIRHIFNK